MTVKSILLSEVFERYYVMICSVILFYCIDDIQRFYSIHNGLSIDISHQSQQIEMFHAY